MEKYPLNEDQLAIYFDILKYPNTNKYNVGFYIYFRAEINLTLFKRAVQQMSSEDRVLRIVISEDKGEYFQVVKDDIEPDFLFVDFSNRNISEKDVNKKMEDEIYRKYDLFAGPLVRTLLIKRGADEYCFLVAMHHLISDATAVKNYFQRFSDVYERLHTGQEVEREQDSAFLEYLGKYRETTNSMATVNFWSDYCREIEPLDFRMGRQDVNKEVCYRKILDETLSEKIRAYCSGNSFLVATFFLTIYSFIIKRYTQAKSNFCILSDYHGRVSKESTSQGYFIKLLPTIIRAKVLDEKTVIAESIRLNAAELTKTIGQFRVSALKIFKLLTGHETLFKFNYFPLRFTDVSFLGKETEIRTDLLRFATENKPAVTIMETPKRFEVQLNVFTSEQDSILSDFPEKIAYVAEQVVSGAETIKNLEILSAHEKEKILIQFNDTNESYPNDKTVTRLFEEQAEKSPDSMAVVFNGEKLRYQQLNEKANQLAHYLRKQGVKENRIVAILMERSLNAIISMLGVLKAGGAYVVLDPEYPASRIDFLLKDTNALAVITQSDFTGRTSDGNVRKVVLDELRDELSKESKDNRVRCDNLEDTVYCIYTSGSTGVPKGVLVKHRGLLNYVISIVKRIQFEERGTFALVSTLTADLGNTMVFPSLCVGGCLHVISKEAATDAMMISDYFRRNRIDYLKIVPSHLIALLNEDKRCKHTLPKKILVLGGEALQDDWIAKIRKIGKCRIFNHYGPTETTVGVSTYDVSQFREHDTLPTVPIGKPLSNTQFYVLDSSLAPVPVGVMGELFIGGDCLARGYLNRPDQTAERFIPNPFSQDKATRLYRTGDLVRWLPDGNVEFLGRVDDQVKVRGFRIELGEIQNLLLKHENIRDAFLLAKKKEDGLSHAIFAYIVPKDRSKELKAAQLNEYICDKLPEYMVPARYVFLDKMPLTPNGKIDRKALPEPESVSQDLEDTYVAPRTPEEKMLCDVWKRILKVEKVSIYDNFFELGGDSLIAIRATFKLKSLGIKGDVLRGIFSGKTIAEMAGEMASGEGAAKPKISKGIEETKKTSKIISIRESVNALRGIALLLLIFNHWAPGFSMRIFGGWHEKFYEIASKNLPGTVFFAFSFGIALGYAYWSLIVSGKDKQAMKLLRSRIPIILVALFLFSLPNYIRNFVNDKTTPTDWALAMSDILFYYFLAVLSSPLWFRIAAKTKRPVVACFMLAAGNELLAMLAHNLKLGSAFDHGWLLLFRDNLQGYYGYFDLTACVTAGLAFGIWLQGVAVNGGQKDGAIKRMLVIGAMLAAAGIFMGGLSVISSTGEYRIGLWQAVSYGGLSMLIVLLFSQMENMKEGVAGWMAKKGRGILSSIGLSTLAIFILHTYTIPVKGVLRSMGLTDTLSLLISVGAFLLGSYLVARLIHNLKAPI